MPEPTLTPSNNSSIMGGGLDSDVNIIIEQGPRWLIDFYFTPPWWVNPLLKLLGLLAVLLVAYRLHQRDWRLDLETQREMQIIVATVVGVITATLAAVNLLDLPYVWDVGLGFGLGYGSVLVCQVAGRYIEVGVPAWVFRTGVWFALALAAFVLPGLVMLDGQGLSLSSSRFLLVGIALVVAFQNIFYASRDEELTATTPSGLSDR